MERNNEYLTGNDFAKGNAPNQTAFKKGHEPWNKNIKGIHLSVKSEFKKGQKPLNWMPVKTIRRRKCKNGKFRNFIKIEEPNLWVLLAKHNWIAKYKKVIKGDVIHHMDGNQENDPVDNLIAFPRADHPIFHNQWGLKQLSEEQLSFYISRYL